MRWEGHIQNYGFNNNQNLDTKLTMREGNVAFSLNVHSWQNLLISVPSKMFLPTVCNIRNYPSLVCRHSYVFQCMREKLGRPGQSGVI